MKIKEKISKLIHWLSVVVIVNIRDEDNYELKQTLRLKHWKAVLYVFLIVAGIFFLSFILIKTLLASWFDPSHIRLESNKKIISLNYKLDSLEQELSAREVYLKNIKSLVNGGLEETDKTKAELKSDSLNEKSHITALDEISHDELEIRKEFEEKELLNGLLQSKSNGSFVKFNLISPLSGIITAKFDLAQKHYGVDIVAKPKSTINTISDGRVIFADWTKEFGYMLVIQHKENLISVYKHNASLVKREGDFVKSGEPISIIGNSGELTDGPHLHFEIWMDGNPLNPQKYITFE